MPLLEDAKAFVERRTGLHRPKAVALFALLRRRTPRRFRFKATEAIPNNRWPLLVYRAALRLDKAYDPAAIFEVLFETNGWRGSWRDGMYDWLHYHSNTHEVLGVARGWLRARFGGAGGREIKLTAGDVIVLPAGVGHYRVRKSADLLIVGAYPGARKYDECTPDDTDDKARRKILRVPAPRKDPVYGKDGPLLRAWKA
jgi:uncharacterized protein YjlB